MVTGAGVVGLAASRRAGARGRGARTGKDDRNPWFVAKFRGHTWRNVLSAEQPESASVRGGPQATLGCCASRNVPARAIGKLIVATTAAPRRLTLEELSDVHFPDAQQITLVEDNLSTHTAASLHSAFSAPEPPRKAVRMALHSQTWKLASPAIPPRPQIRNQAKHRLQESFPYSPARGG